jgi:hypothetical protein
MKIESVEPNNYVGKLIIDMGNDNVNKPNHYKGEIECIDAIKSSMTIEEVKGFLKGNVQKYVWRYDKKNGIEDLKKAQWYLDKLIKENE